MTHDTLELLRDSLVASVQASAGTPARDTHVIGALAESALLGGASGLRLNGPEDLRRVRSATAVPLIGLHKVWNGVRNVITPDVALAEGLAAAGADVIAVDATTEQLGTDFGLLGRIAQATGLPVMADVSTAEEGRRAWEAGAAVVGTTLSGYTPHSPRQDGPDLDLVAALAAAGIPTIAEGRYQTPEQVRAAFDAGAFAVVVGGAITDPIALTRRFVAATPKAGERV
ncbi:MULTISPECIES: N-acetylmannosamine-6-phosphate 2-epimerase [Microbacterium]|uniref:N-acylglucosamine-6-phosphate 2-epimerase n=1 Tax=Microbacterium sufflavum TaxID=2851649 RepID=A0ABY4IFQ8_9MICO|nr:MULTISPECIES: putative N-acetylmannosamine-6-phosphate 2-epimerase [Microbacterium]MCK2025973.1 putative N-acetylmannosamine-6-phosphate 2-epimerase [Microbacterium sufflavum]UPL10791.1 putative N-acetylmannosamine-6-phosphate 2-epimerase [Microbacterium sufflavum]